MRYKLIKTQRLINQSQCLATDNKYAVKKDPRCPEVSEPCPRRIFISTSMSVNFKAGTWKILLARRLI